MFFILYRNAYMSQVFIFFIPFNISEFKKKMYQCCSNCQTAFSEVSLHRRNLVIEMSLVNVTGSLHLLYFEGLNSYIWTARNFFDTYSMKWQKYLSLLAVDNYNIRFNLLLSTFKLHWSNWCCCCAKYNLLTNVNLSPESQFFSSCLQYIVFIVHCVYSTLCETHIDQV